MLDKIKNTIRNNIWGWSFLITFGILVSFSWKALIFGVLFFLYGMSIQKSVTWKNALMIGAKIFFGAFVVPLVFFCSIDYSFIMSGIDYSFIMNWKIVFYASISTFVFTVVACLLNLMIGQKGQLKDKEAEQEKVINEDKRKHNLKVWNRSAFISLLIVAVLAFIAEIGYLESTHESSLFSSLFSMLVLGTLLFCDWVFLIFSSCFSFWSEKIKQQLLWEKALILGGCISVTVYGGMMLVLPRDVYDCFFILFVFFRIVAFTLFYAALIGGAEDEFKIEKQGK